MRTSTPSGVVLFELLTGGLPFDLGNVTPSEAQQMVTQQAPPAPSSLLRRNSSITAAVQANVKRSEWADLDVMCLKALQKEPERRYQAIDSLLGDVRAFLKGEPLSARPDSWRYRTGKFVHRNRNGVTALVFALIVISGLIGAFVWRLNRERQAVLSKSAEATRLLQFTLDLFSGGQRVAGPPSDLRVSELLERGTQRARRLQRDPLQQSEILMTLGTIFQNIGELGKAEDNMREAWALRIRTPGGEALAAQSQIALALVLCYRGHLEEAEKDARAGLSVLENLKGAHDPDVLHGKVTLGEILGSRGANNAVIQLLEPVVRLQQTAGSPELDRAYGFYELSVAYKTAGDYARAAQDINSYLILQRSLYGAIHPSIADGEQWLCQIQRDTGALAEAERHCRAALSIGQTWYGRNHAFTGSAMRALGVVLTKEHKLQEARSLLERALALAQSTAPGELHEGFAIALQSLAINEYYSANYAAAERHYNLSLAILRKVYGNDHQFNVAVILFQLAEIAGKRNDYGRAEELVRRSLPIFVEVQGTEGPKPAMAHVQIGHFLLCKKSYSEAKQESLLGYSLLTKQPNPESEFYEMAKRDLAEENKNIAARRIDTQ